MRGMNSAAPTDQEVVALLTKMQALVSAISTDINGDDADQLRGLQIAVFESKCSGIWTAMDQIRAIGSVISTVLAFLFFSL